MALVRDAQEGGQGGGSFESLKIQRSSAVCRSSTVVLTHHSNTHNMAKINLTYEQALARIEEITGQIETGEMNVDELAKQVKEASDLLKFCKSKLFETEQEIEKILKEMEEEKE